MQDMSSFMAMGNVKSQLDSTYSKTKQQKQPMLTLSQKDVVFFNSMQIDSAPSSPAKSSKNYGKNAFLQSQHNNSFTNQCESLRLSSPMTHKLSDDKELLTFQTVDCSFDGGTSRSSLRHKTSLTRTPVSNRARRQLKSASGKNVFSAPVTNENSDASSEHGTTKSKTDKSNQPTRMMNNSTILQQMAMRAGSSRRPQIRVSLQQQVASFQKFKRHSSTLKNNPAKSVKDK